MTLSVDITRSHRNEHASERNARTESQSTAKGRRVVAAVGMLAPLTAFLAAAAWYLTV